MIKTDTEKKIGRAEEARLVDEMSDDELLALWDRPYQERWPVSKKEIERASAVAEAL